MQRGFTRVPFPGERDRIPKENIVVRVSRSLPFPARGNGPDARVPFPALGKGPEMPRGASSGDARVMLRQAWRSFGGDGVAFRRLLSRASSPVFAFVVECVGIARNDAA